MTDETKTNPRHPFRDAELRVYRRLDGGEFVARFAPTATYPLLFSATSEVAVREKAETFRADAIARHEDAFVARQEALERRVKPAPRRERMP